eukprot:scaffold641_cov237-Pinguiococcus_pyrenoidosus.AAC.8
MVMMYSAQARDAVRKCVAGENVENALKVRCPGVSGEPSGGGGHCMLGVATRSMFLGKHDISEERSNTANPRPYGPRRAIRFEGRRRSTALLMGLQRYG